MAEKNSRVIARLSDLGVTFDDQSGILEVLRGINLDVREREFLCVLGPTGSGKTTLLQVVGGLVSPTSGQISFPAFEQPRVGLVFQGSNLMPWRTVMENIILPLELRGVDPVEARRRASEMVALVGLDEFADVWPAALSGGMAQRVAIARAYIQDPDLLLLDEPFGSLDAITRERMGAELLRIWQSDRKTVFMVTHSIPEALMLADRVVVLTHLPGEIELDLPVGLPRPRDESVRYSKEFRDLSRRLRVAIE